MDAQSTSVSDIFRERSLCSSEALPLLRKGDIHTTCCRRDTARGSLLDICLLLRSEMMALLMMISFSQVV